MGVLAITSERHLEIVNRNALKIVAICPIFYYLPQQDVAPYCDVHFYLMAIKKNKLRAILSCSFTIISLTD